MSMKSKPVGLTPAQIEKRRGYIGASDVAAILGWDQWANAADVWKSKVERLAQSESVAAYWGNRLEDDLIDWTARELQIDRDQITHGSENVGPCGIVRATLDAFIPARAEIIEAKSSGYADGWGDPDVSGDVPLKFLAQAAAQLYCTPEAGVVWIPALIGVNGWSASLYRVDRTDEIESLIEKMIPALHHFWSEHVVKRVAPPNVVPHFDTCKRVVRAKGKVFDPTTEQEAQIIQLLDALSLHKERRLDSEKQERQIKAALTHIIGDAETCVLSDGRDFSYFSVDRRGYTVEDAKYRKLVVHQPK